MPIIDYISKRYNANSVLGGNGRLVLCPLYIIGPYLQHLFCRKLRVPMSFPLRGSVLGCRVKTVNFGVSYEKVIRSNARRIIAFMKNIHSVWNFPVVNYPRDSMGLVKSVSEPEHTVSVFVGTAYPKPAVVGFENLPPKTVLHRSVSSASRRPNFWTNIREWYNLILHKSVGLICATLSAAHTAREHFFIMAQTPMRSTL